MERGRIQGLPQLLKYPLFSGMGKATNVKWQMYSEDPCEQKSIKHLGENGAWAYTGTAQIF